MDRTVRNRLLTNPVVRVKIWDSSGRIVYSDEPALIGVRYSSRQPSCTRCIPAGLMRRIGSVSSREPLRASVPQVARGVPRAACDQRNAGPVRALSALQLDYRQRQPPVQDLLVPDDRDDGAPRARPDPARGVTRATGAQRPAGAGGIAAASDRSLRDRTPADCTRPARRAGARSGRSVVTLSSAIAEAEEVDPALAEALGQTSRQTRESIRALRTLLVDIYPPRLHSEGLIAAVSDLMSALSAAGLETSLDADPQLHLQSKHEAVLFRAAQESLRNVLRHAQAKKVTVRVRASAGIAVLEVEDDGRGMTDGPRGLDEHFGLRMLEDLARDSDGRLELDSVPGRGTAVRLGDISRMIRVLLADDHGLVARGAEPASGRRPGHRCGRPRRRRQRSGPSRV